MGTAVVGVRLEQQVKVMEKCRACLLGRHRYGGTRASEQDMMLSGWRKDCPIWDGAGTQGIYSGSNDTACQLSTLHLDA